MKKRKLFLLSSSLLSTAGFLAAASCGSSESSESKEIVVAVDGVQQNFYKEIIEKFQNTESYKEGYRIKTITKDVWSALDFGVQGLNDPLVPDIFYGPQDRLTDFVQKNALVDLSVFSPTLFSELATNLNLSDVQRQEMEAFGKVVGKSTDGLRNVEQFVGLRHNKEGIILASNKSEEETRTIFNNTNTDTLKELVEAGETVLRIQDLWYGNGVFYGGMETYFNSLSEEEQEAFGKNFANILASKILYYDGTKTTSGFIKTDKHHEIYKKGLEAVADLVWPIIEAAYIKNETEFAETVWGRKGFKQGDLQGLYVSNMGNVHDSLMQFMSEGKLSYALIGTWDVQNSERAGKAKSFFNVLKVNETVPYKQAQGSWAYMVNSRNNGASEGRKKAITEVLKLAFQPKSYYEYFKTDSKVPFADSRQTEINRSIEQENSREFERFNKLSKDLGYSSISELQTATSEFLKPLIAISRAGINWNAWEKTTDATSPMSEQNMIPASEMQITGDKKATFISDESYNTLNSSLTSTLPLRNTIASLLGLTDDWSNQLVGGQGNQPWQVGEQILKDGAFAALSEEYNDNIVQEAANGENKGSFHMRKVEKIIFGANGDNKESDVLPLIEEISNAIKENKLEELQSKIVAKAKVFSNKAAKTTVDDATIEKVAKAYFGNYVNAARISSLVKSELANKNMPKKDNTSSEYKGQQVIDELAKYDKLLSFDKILKVVTSTKDLKNNGIGVLTTQPTRFDSSNPQFSHVWGRWNDRTFGNAEFYKTLKGKGVTTKEQFVSAIEDNLSSLFSEWASTFTDPTATSVIIETK